MRYAQSVSSLHRALRPNYPYSVIPGGAYSPEELRDRVGHDPIIAAHYADFALSKARLVFLAHDQIAFVSYRIGNRILWTTRALRLLKGETLLTDGQHYSRTRCGNRLSIEPHPSTAKSVPEEPIDAVAAPDLTLPLPHDREIAFFDLPIGNEFRPPLSSIAEPPVFPLDLSKSIIPCLACKPVPRYPDLPRPPGWFLPTSFGFPLITTKVRSDVAESMPARPTVKPAGLALSAAVPEPSWMSLAGLVCLGCAGALGRSKLALRRFGSKRF